MIGMEECRRFKCIGAASGVGRVNRLTNVFINEKILLAWKRICCCDNFLIQPLRLKDEFLADQMQNEEGKQIRFPCDKDLVVIKTRVRQN